MKFYFSAVNLWCNKNLVDLECIIWNIFKLKNKFDIKFFALPEDNEVEFILINTCWFLKTSRQEAQKELKYYNKLWKKIILLGCYIPLKDNNFLKKLKNLIYIIPFENYNKIQKIIIDIIYNKKKLSDKINNKIKEAFVFKWTEDRLYLNQIYKYEYLKIAEWCDNKCSFCIIPQIRWKQKSKKINDILSEINLMLNAWIKEIILIAQDTTRYWVDLYWKPKLLELLTKIEKIPKKFKYRLLYMYPDNLSFSMLQKLCKFKKFIPYFDIPFQHISSHILKKMWRFYDTDHIYKMLDFIKNNFKIYHIRTSFIIWFPQEKHEDFLELKNFILKYKFDSIALFQYHDEKLAASYKLKNKVSSKEAILRIKELDKVIKKVSQNQIKKNENWYIMNFNNKFAMVRRELVAPEIDKYDKIKLSDLNCKNISIWKIIKL